MRGRGLSVLDKFWKFGFTQGYRGLRVYSCIFFLAFSCTGLLVVFLFCVVRTT